MVEALFFKTYHSYLLGNLSDTKMFFEFLVEEFKNRKDPNALNRKQLKELKKIRSAVETGKIETARWVGELISDSSNDISAPDIKQKELVRKIHFDGLSMTRKLLQVEDLELYDIEHPCGVYGAVDMVYRSQDTIYPVEVKRHEGKHDLIGQIGKYSLYFRLKVHLKHFSDVRPVTICNSYNLHTLSELRRMSVIPLKYDIVEEKIKIGIV
jgi:hypothetical protein